MPHFLLLQVDYHKPNAVVYIIITICHSFFVSEGRMDVRIKEELGNCVEDKGWDGEIRGLKGGLAGECAPAWH